MATTIDENESPVNRKYDIKKNEKKIDKKIDKKIEKRSSEA